MLIYVCMYVCIIMIMMIACIVNSTYKSILHLIFILFVCICETSFFVLFFLKKETNWVSWINASPSEINLFI